MNALFVVMGHHLTTPHTALTALASLRFFCQHANLRFRPLFAVDPMTIPPAPIPRRIVMVAHSRKLGGIERHVVALSDALREAGHSIAYAGPRQGWLGQAMADAGHDAIDLPMRGMYDAPSAWRLCRFARRWGADLMHGHAQRGTRYAQWGATSQIPAIGTAHSTNAWKWFRKDTPIITVSAAVRQFLLAQGYAPDRLHLIYPGSRDLGLAPPPDPAPLSANRPLMLGMLARLEPVKGHDIALEALRLLPGDLAVRLAIIGPDTTEWAQQMKDRVTQMGLSDRVSFWGARSDLQAVFAQMDIMLAPSRREALCLSLIEAGAAGRPGIGANIGGIPEVIDDGISGMLIPPEDPAALANAISRLATAPELRRRMGQAARQVFESRFTRTAMVRGIEACYDRVILTSGGNA